MAIPRLLRESIRRAVLGALVEMQPGASPSGIEFQDVVLVGGIDTPVTVDAREGLHGVEVTYIRDDGGRDVSPDDGEMDNLRIHAEERLEAQRQGDDPEYDRQEHYSRNGQNDRGR